MPRVIVWVEDAVAPVTAQLVKAFQQAMLSAPYKGHDAPDALTVLDPATWEKQRQAGSPWDAKDLFLPLTLNLPSDLDWAEHFFYATCRDVAGLRQQVAPWGYPTGDGTLALPIVLTAKGPLYAEVIGPSPDPASLFVQPVHLSDTVRQPLYALGQRLLRSLIAPPAVYLLQFSIQENISEQRICFDRLLPFPDERAIARLDTQTPDLFMCHWLCKTHQPIRDLLI
jgi:hypothetical protein